MPKRKEQYKTDDEESGSETDLVNVDFDFFDPEEIDFIALKRLMTQLFQADAEGFYLTELADLIIKQPQLGTMVKMDGKDSDPYAFLTVLNMNVHKDHPSIKALIDYLLAKTSSNTALHATLQGTIGAKALESDRHIGLLLGERLVNMPVQVIPPMYRMLGEEIQWAIEEVRGVPVDPILDYC
ncbi:Mss4p nuclear export [Tulasnella sp. 419]|nr:Mss4p nuclear export [Tulasnella sp. 419]